MSKFCSGCGTELDEEIKFCKNCGKSVQENSNEVKVIEPEVVSGQNLEDNRKYDGFAITSLVVSLAGIFVCRFICAVLGLIFGLLALKRIKNSNKKGRGMAIAGISVSGVILGIIIVVLFIGLMIGAAVVSIF